MVLEHRDALLREREGVAGILRRPGHEEREAFVRAEEVPWLGHQVLLVGARGKEVAPRRLIAVLQGVEERLAAQDGKLLEERVTFGLLGVVRVERAVEKGRLL